MLAPTDGTGSGHEGCKKPKGIPINESALRDVEAAAIGQPVLVFVAATGRGIDEAFDRRLCGHATRFRRAIRDALLSKPRANELRDQLCRYVSSSRSSMPQASPRAPSPWTCRPPGRAVTNLNPRERSSLDVPPVGFVSTKSSVATSRS
jgi:hypothetical protein